MDPNEPSLTGNEASEAVNAGYPGEKTSFHHSQIRIQILLVLGLSLGQSAIYALVALIGRLTDTVPLAKQSTTLNPRVSARPVLDLTYQILGLGFALVPVLLALFWLGTNSAVQQRIFSAGAKIIGLDWSRIGKDLGAGICLAAVIGLPGLGFYCVGRWLGITVAIQASGLSLMWWTIPVLVLSAIKNAVLEEVIMVGYLDHELKVLGWRPSWRLGTSAALRGCYHLYQGIGPGLGNIVMGTVFSWWFQKTNRTMSLVIAHTLLDIVAFVGYQLAMPYLISEGVLTWLGIG